MTKTAIVLFCDDFRVKDNPALFHACQNFENIIPVFIYNENYQGRKIGAAQKVFLHHALKNFDKLLEKEYGAKLILKQGNEIDELLKINELQNFDAIYFNNSYSKNQIETENLIKKQFAKKEVNSFKAKILFEPNDIKNGSGQVFKVFTPFSKECLKNIDKIGDFLKAPSSFKSSHKIKSLKIEDLNLLPKDEGNWHEKMIANWEFNYDKIDEKISDFLQNKLKNYHEDRNMAAKSANSGISPYFRFGMVSPRIVVLAALNYDHHQQFVLEILWREFAYHTAFVNPEIANKEIKPQYSEFSWKNDQKMLKKWQKGETGFDIVDAGMKELWAVGIMHNRVRMIVASFLIKDLFINWRIGEQYFFDCLVDGDTIVNAFSWQWVFGSGLDAAPYFRVFNPQLQQERFDPKGEYCQRWLGSRIMVPKIVDHSTQRDIVLAEYKRIINKS
jgi:deoxyribodipyrimidine photo-lyase